MSYIPSPPGPPGYPIPTPTGDQLIGSPLSVTFTLSDASTLGPFTINQARLNADGNKVFSWNQLLGISGDRIPFGLSVVSAAISWPEIYSTPSFGTLIVQFSRQGAVIKGLLGQQTTIFGISGSAVVPATDAPTAAVTLSQLSTGSMDVTFHYTDSTTQTFNISGSALATLAVAQGYGALQTAAGLVITSLFPAPGTMKIISYTTYVCHGFGGITGGSITKIRIDAYSEYTDIVHGVVNLQTTSSGQDGPSENQHWPTSGYVVTIYGLSITGTAPNEIEYGVRILP
jgi:hypothetical protein